MQNRKGNHGKISAMVQPFCAMMRQTDIKKLKPHNRFDTMKHKKQQDDSPQ